jgi:hypothetical protein
MGITNRCFFDLSLATRRILHGFWRFRTLLCIGLAMLEDIREPLELLAARSLLFTTRDDVRELLPEQVAGALLLATTKGTDEPPPGLHELIRPNHALLLGRHLLLFSCQSCALSLRILGYLP